jgi:calcineurin-like phosphoesterase
LEEYASDKSVSAIIVDFHAEATSEKHALRHYANGKITALLGTHTHVQTNDAFVSPQGTAYITDVGMTGVYQDSVIGIHPKNSLDRFLFANSTKWELAEGPAIFQAVLIEVDDTTRQAVSIEIIQR